MVVLKVFVLFLKQESSSRARRLDSSKAQGGSKACRLRSSEARKRDEKGFQQCVARDVKGHER